MPRSKKKRNNSARNELLRQTVLEAAAQLFAERGFGGTNLQDIADSLGISRPAVYYYFRSKEAILQSLVEEVTVFSRQQSTRVASQVDLDPSDILRTMARNHASGVLQHRILFRVLDRSENDLPPKIRRMHEASKQTLLDDFTQIITRGVDEARFRPVDPRVAAFAIIGLCNWTAWWFKEGARLSSDQVADIIADLAVNAVQRSNARQIETADPTELLRVIREDISHLEISLSKGLAVRSKRR